ncbi:hypothetical protein [Flavobacterium sp.]|uniref:hypothetical protein n=1 Tax=Flavobacterium sp. TaxID=239 RepID=UPI00286AE5EE|nr:hypothetical protein [Flavobacterium sp.]
MKTTFTMIALMAIFTFTSCKKESDKEVTTETTVTDTTAVADEAPAFEPFQVMAISYTVKNYEVWKKVFDERESTRAESGLTTRALARGTDNPNKIYLFLNVADMQKAKEYAANPKLKEVRKTAGVTSEPEVIYSNVVRFEESPAEFKDRVRVSIKIKDFDAWRKVYDAEGKEIRLANGLIDRAIAQSIDDPNMIYVTFAVSNMTKAKTYMKAPELKKLMTEAGVISKPVIDFYTSVL